MKLHFRTLGDGEPLIILHGVFGSSDNWQTLGKVFAEKFKVYLVDLRNHGNSPHSSEFDYDLMVEDLMDLMSDERIEQAHILGHSMGGKVAMHLATKFPEKLIKLIVVDIAPKYYPPHHQQIFEGFHSVKLDSIDSRKEADEQMAAIIPNIGVRQFILKNLTRGGDGNFAWKLNVSVIETAIEAVGGGLDKDVSFNGPSLFISGGNSDYIKQDDYQLIANLFPSAEIKTVDGAGHWVHAEKPEDLKNVVLNFLS